MRDFCRLISILISLAGFLIVAVTLLMRGECLLTAAIKSSLVFTALWVVQGFLSNLINQAAGKDEQ